MRKSVSFILAMALFIGIVASYAQDSSKVIAKNPNEEATAQRKDQVVVYYLHMNRRCMTCQKLEAFSKEAIESGFDEQLKDSSIVFKVENFEAEGNEHFARDYQLYNQSLIVSRQHDGKETDWKNLEDIWKLVGNKEEFIAYVQTEVADFMNQKEK